MNNAPEPHAELLQLCTELAEGELDAAQRSRLQELLRNDAAQRFYLQFMSLHAALHIEYGEGAYPSGLPGLSLLAERPETKLAPVAAVDERQPRDRRRWLLAGALAASLLFALTTSALFMLLRHPTEEEPVVADKATDSPAFTGDPTAVAVLTQTVGATLIAVPEPATNSSGAVKAVAGGSGLRPGRYRVDAGLAQLEFFNGASLIVEGPADFEIVSLMRVVCARGKLRAHVPPPAQGFTIAALGRDAIDLGTEFALSVSDQGQAEVHVLEGEVELRDPGQAAPEKGGEKLSAGRGVRFQKEQAPTQIAAAPESFVSREKLLQLAEAEHRDRYQAWLAESQKLRADPATLLYYSFEQRPAWERSLPCDGPADERQRDGAIVGCLWTEGRWPGKGALEFKRTTDRVRINVPGEFNSLTLAAWVRIEGFDRWLSSLMLTDGYDKSEVHWQLSDRGEMILGVHQEDGINFFSPTVITPADLGRWVHLLTVYDGQAGQVTHYLDGKAVSRQPISHAGGVRIGPAEIGNWRPNSPQATYPIRSLNGRMDEFAIFSRAFSAEEAEQMYRTGKTAADAADFGQAHGR